MANKQVQDITVRLGIKGFEGLDRLKGSFRELAKVTNLSDRDISRARKTLIDFAEKAGNTQQASKGLIDALKGLQAQATRNSSTYNKLSKDIIDLNQSLRLTDAEIQKQAELLAKSARAHTQSEASIKGHVKALQDLRTQASLGGQAYNQIGVEIDQLNGKLDESTKKNSSYRGVLGRALPKDAEKLSDALEQLRQVLADSGNTAEQTGRAMAQLAIGGATESRARIVAFTEEINKQRIAVSRLGEEFLDLPRTPAVYAQRLAELNLELNNSIIASKDYYEILADISTLQLELQRAQSVGRGQILFERLSLPEGAASRLASTQRNLGMVIGALREEMSMLDTSTAEGSAKFAQQAQQVEQLEGQLKKLNDQYVSVGQSQAAVQQGINPYGPSGARNPLYDEDMARQAVEGVKDFRKTYNDTIDSLISAKQNFREHEARLIAENDRQEEEASRAQIARSQAENDALGRAFMEQLELRTNLLDVQRRAAASAMGFGGQELSPLYERITGLAGASVQREQLMMGRSATQVLTDMLTAFEKGGRGVDIKQKSTQIGESIAQGVVKGASDKSVLASGANSLSEQFLASLKKAFRIKSPSGESRDEIGVPIGQGIGQGIIQGLKEVRGDVLAAVRLLFSDISASPQRAGLPAQQTALADKLQSFLARTSAKTSTYLPFARLMGEEAVSSPALTLAAYRKAYERGGIVPSMYMPAERRRNVRGVSGIPGFGLEQEIIAGAIRNVGRTGAFVGPLGGPRVSLSGARSLFSAGIGMQRRGATPFAGQSAPLFGASSPVPARGAVRYGMAAAETFPVEGMLGQGRALAFGRGGAIASTKEAISSYRKAVSNFWEGETGTFETIRRIVSSGVQLSASRLARRLTETVELPNLSGIRGRIRGAMPSLPSMRMGLPNVSIPGMSALHEFLTGDEAFMRRLDRQEMAYGVSRLGGFPVSGMAQIGNIGAGGGSFVPMSGGAIGGGGGGRPPAAIVPPAAPSEYEKLTAAVSRFGDVSRRSTADLRDFSGSLRLLQDILDPTAADFKQVNREIEKQGRLVDRELEKRQRGGRRRMTGMQMAQAAGAALSGGIFGGPEGFLGGALGGVFGGVGGAFAGAAAGAQIGGLRQQLGGFADYAAQIQKMEIALKNAAGGQAEFNQAMAAASAATRDLNVPQDVAIQGMTRLTAAVVGAEGSVSDAELVFKNVTSAIKATGGSAEDVDGAITAMVQVFSKGKVSAEELSGQLGERLPGAVTKFAKANDMTLPELQKALEQGQVGLNELMNFIVQLGDEYSGVAEKIAGSSQDAGARLTVAYNQMRIAVGEALQPIGAQFQEAFIPFIENITPTLEAVLPKIGELALGVAKNLDVLAASLAALAAGAIVNAIAQTGGLVAAFGALKAAILATNAALLLNPWVALAAGITAATVALIKYNQAQEEYKNLIDNGAGSTEELKETQRKLEEQINASKKALEGGADGMGATGREAMRLKGKIAELENQLARINKTFKIRLSIESQGIELDDKGRMKGFTVAGIKYDAQGNPIGRVDGTPLNGLSDFQRPDSDKIGKTKSEADKAAREAQRAFDERLQKMLREEDHTLKKFALEEKIRLEREKQNAIQSGTLESETQLSAIAQQRLDLDIKATALASENIKLDELRKQGLAEGLDVEKIAKQMQENIIKDLEIQYENQKLNTQEIEAQIDLEKERENLNRALNQELQDRRYELGLITKEEYNRLQIERERRRLEEQYRGLPGAQGRIEEGVDLFRREIDPTFAEGLQSQLAVVRQELDELTKPINQVVGAATAIGDAFSQSFASVINGSATTQEALASFFQNLANYFLDMAAQIIQKMIVMAILNQIVGLLPGAKGIGQKTGPVGPLQSGGDFNIPGTISTGILAAANGMAFAKNGIQPFAMGGIVNKPTLFKYADGGSGRFGLMGEAGPEAIIPLKRGRDGKLGVAGGGGVNVTVNVDAQGTKVQGDNNQGQQLGRAVAAAVQQELIKQKRPGGLLA